MEEEVSLTERVICAWFHFLPSVFELAEGIMKETDSGIRTSSPTVVLEVGDSESLTQLRNDAVLWLESEYMHGVATSSESLLPLTRTFRYGWL